jgi:hypothetical protein
MGTKLQAFKRYYSNKEIEERYGVFSDNRAMTGWKDSEMIKRCRATITEIVEKYVTDKAARNKIFDAVAEIEGESEFEGFMIGFRDAAQLYGEGGDKE